MFLISNQISEMLRLIEVNKNNGPVTKNPYWFDTFYGYNINIWNTIWCLFQNIIIIRGDAKNLGWNDDREMFAFDWHLQFNNLEEFCRHLNDKNSNRWTQIFLPNMTELKCFKIYKFIKANMWCKICFTLNWNRSCTAKLNWTVKPGCETLIWSVLELVAIAHDMK